MIQFYAPDIADTPTLPESDSQHAVRVLRLREGDELTVVDGKGRRYRCVITGAHQRHTTVEILSSETLLPSWSGEIVAAVAPSKHLDRMEWMTEKLTEIGVDRIIPLLCRRSERRELKPERLEKIAVAAMKQSLKAVLPVVEPMTPVGEVTARYAGAQALIAYCDRSIPRRELVATYRSGAPVTAIMIGPEGDFAPEEIKAALDAGWKPVALGPERLRTETAALRAVDAIHILDQYRSITDNPEI